MPRNIHRRIQAQLALLALLIVALIGIGGYMLIEKMNAVDAIYTTIIVLTTIGMNTQPLSKAGEIFTAVLAVSGLETVTIAAGFLIRDIVAGELNTMLGRRIMQRQISALKDHFILCGYGRLGRVIAAEIARTRIPLVIVEQDQQRFVDLINEGYVGVLGSALDDETLKQAGVERAKTFISAIDRDADNVFLILSARELNPEIFIVVRAEKDSAKSKLEHVGANKVISPFTVGAELIAQAALRPNVLDFINLTTRASNERYQIEEVVVSDKSHLVDKTLAESGISREHGVIIIGIRRKTEEDSTFNPSARTVIAANDILIVLGESQNVEKFKSLVRA
jgi:voltage-gated potassium channel